MGFAGTRQVVDIPSPLPVLPIRNTVIFPNAAVPLMVGRSKSLKAIRHAQRSGDLILVIAQRDGSKEDPGPADLYSTGVVCLVSKLSQLEAESFQLLANGLFRFRVTEFFQGDQFLTAVGTQLAEEGPPDSARSLALVEEVRKQGKEILTLAAIPGAETLNKLFQQVLEPSHVADLAATFLQLPVPTKQTLLEELRPEKRLETVLELLLREKERLALQNEIQSRMMERLSKEQRDHLLREQVRTIHDELGEDANFADDYRAKVEAAGMPEEAKKAAHEELARLGQVQRSSPEFHVIRTYLDWLVAVPWQRSSAPSPEKIDLETAKGILDSDHLGIEKVKQRVIQFLAVNKLKSSLSGPILCLVGPPGVGKTSLGKSIAKAIGREFVRTSLGGMRDEAEIRGHRRTYIGAMPGKLIQSLKRAKVNDPVILLDEIDKIGQDFRGDPASALLEVLDPEQNKQFQDHYLDVACDLSRIFFITTANQLDTIPPALRDRLEVIEMSSYSRAEKIAIASQHLVPKALSDHGLTATQLVISADLVGAIIDDYTAEAGVRNLTREIATLCRSAAESFLRQPSKPLNFSVADLPTILGPKRFFRESRENLQPGVATGLAWTALGGEILRIEVTRMPGKGQLILTGKLGDVMKESAQLALSFLRSYWGKTLPFHLAETDLHIHVPSGAVPKDGPSAGVALFAALASLVEGQPVSADLALTGEITLRGKILPVGGIKEKILAAHRAGLTHVCLPAKNGGDLADIPSEVRASMRFTLLAEMAEILPVLGFDAPLVGLGAPPSRNATESHSAPLPH